MKIRKKDKHIEVEESILRKLTMFETIAGKYNELGHEVEYTRVPNGLIRTCVNTEAISQAFINLPNTWFTIV